MPTQNAFQDLINALSYFYHSIFFPSKNDTMLAFWSSGFVWVSYELHDLSLYLEYFSMGWAIAAKVLSGLILVMNFSIVALSLKKRIQDWINPEQREENEEFQKRNKMKS